MLFEDTVDILSPDCSVPEFPSHSSVLQIALTDALRQPLFLEKSFSLRSSGLDLGDEESLSAALQIEDHLFPDVLMEEEMNEEIAAISAQISRLQNIKRVMPPLSSDPALTKWEYDAEIFDDAVFSLVDDAELLPFALPGYDLDVESFPGSPVQMDSMKQSRSAAAAAAHFQSINTVELVVIESGSPPQPRSSLKTATVAPSIGVPALNSDSATSSKKRKASPKQQSKKKCSPKKEIKQEAGMANAASKILLADKCSRYLGEEVLRISKLQAHEDEEEIDVGDDFDS